MCSILCREDNCKPIIDVLRYSKRVTYDSKMIGKQFWTVVRVPHTISSSFVRKLLIAPKIIIPYETTSSHLPPVQSVPGRDSVGNVREVDRGACLNTTF